MASGYEHADGTIYCTEREKNAGLRRQGKQGQYQDEQGKRIQLFYESSKSGAEFIDLMAGEGLTVARGDRAAIVMVDREGRTKNLTRALQGVKKRDLVETLSDIDIASLPLASQILAARKQSSENSDSGGEVQQIPMALWQRVRIAHEAWQTPQQEWHSPAFHARLEAAGTSSEEEAQKKHYSLIVGVEKQVRQARIEIVLPGGEIMLPSYSNIEYPHLSGGGRFLTLHFYNRYRIYCSGENLHGLLDYLRTESLLRLYCFNTDQHQPVMDSHAPIIRDMVIEAGEGRGSANVAEG